jgi:hypothetical protein
MRTLVPTLFDVIHVTTPNKCKKFGHIILIARVKNQIIRLCSVLIIFILPQMGLAQQLPETKKVYSALEARKGENDDKNRVIRLETELKTTITIPAIEIKSCPARVSLSYYQKNTLVHVDGEIKHDGCEVSGGEFDVITSVRADGGERRTLRFPETWHIDGEGLAEFSKEYLIGENVTLLQVRTSRAKCVCLSDPP